MFWLVVVLVLIVGPIAELWVIIQAAQVIGGWETLALLLVEGFVGGWIMKRQGRTVIRRIDERLRNHQLPTKELADGFLILVAGALMLSPGFISDLIGFTLLFPPTRALARIALLRRFTAGLGQGFSVFTASAWTRPVGADGPVVDTTATERRPPLDRTPLGPGAGGPRAR